MPRTATATLMVALFATPALHAQDPTARVDQIFAFATAETPGCAVGVSQRGKVLLQKGYGLANLDTRAPLGSTSIFDIGSTQKQFTAAAILLLAQDGRLSLSDDVRKYLPELPDYGHPITVDHLITHTSGVRDWTGLLPMAEEGVDVLTLIMRQKGLNTTPGEAWSYSSSGFELAKEIVRRVGGMPVGEFMSRRLFEPLGMTSTSYVGDILQGRGAIASGYQKDGAAWKPYMRLGSQRGGGALISTTADLLTWNDALTNGKLGTFVTTRLHEPARLKNGRVLTYARGLTVDDTPGGRVVSHSGAAAGYSSWLGRVPEHGLSVVVLCNFDPVSATQLSARVAEVFLPPMPAGASRAGPAAVPGVDVEARAGLFLEEPSGRPLRLVANGGRLAIAGGPALVPVAQDRFRPTRASLSFRSQDDFQLTFRSNDAFAITSMEGEVTRYTRAQPWSPTPEDARAFDGRYRSDELGTVLEMFPGPRGLLVRFERSPERTLETLPVARDVYMQGLVNVQFTRGSDGRVTGFVYSNPVAQGIRFARVGDRTPSASPAPVASASAGGVDTTTVPRLEALVGEYEVGPGRSIVISLEDGKLQGAPTGNPKRTLVHVTGTTFSVEGTNSPMTLTFTLDASGQSTAMVMRQNGNERTLRKVR